MVEEGVFSGELVDLVIKKYLPLSLINQKLKSYDTWILGCTHYPFLRKSIEKVQPHGVQIFDSTLYLIEVLSKDFKDKKLKSNTEPKQICFYLSDLSKHFQKLLALLYTGRIDRLESFDL